MSLVVGTPAALGRWSTSGLMNSGAVVHSLTRRAYSSSMARFVWASARGAGGGASAIARGSLMGSTSVYDNPPRRAVGNSHVYGRLIRMRISTWMMAAALLCPALAVHAQENPPDCGPRGP